MLNPDAPGTVNNNSNTWTESKSFFIGLLGAVAGLLALGIEVSGGLSDRHEIIALQKENARLNTLILNHKDKLDNDTIVAQQLLAAATTMLSSCRK